MAKTIGLISGMSNIKALYHSLTTHQRRGRSIMTPAHKIIRIIFIMLAINTPYRDKVVDYGGTSGQRQSAALYFGSWKIRYLPNTALFVLVTPLLRQAI
jgi:hypothetical protein